MVKINFVVVGKIKESYYREALSEYLKRLSAYAKVSVIEVKEENPPLEQDVKKTLQTEGRNITEKLRGRVIALAIEGKKYSSEALSSLIKGYVDKGEEMTFVIGSSRGLSDEVKCKADVKLSFSDMTFPHALMRVILAEQVYRAFTIIAGTGYHK